MNPRARGIIAWIGAAYDKLALFIVLFILLVSVVWLGICVEVEKRKQANERLDQPQSRPRMAQPVNISPICEAIAALAEPFQIEPGSNRMMVAELRVTCVNCKRPIPYQAEVCPYLNCNAAQTRVAVASGGDDNKDGIPNEWARKYGFDPMANIAQEDPDGDGFTNLEEYNARTDPRDPNSFSAPVTKLKWTAITREPVLLRFMSVQRPAPDERIFVVKNKRSGRDYYLKIADEVEGWKVLEFEERMVTVTNRTVGPMVVDKSVLKLRKGDRVITLVLGEDSRQGDLKAELIFLADQSKFTVKLNDEITLKNIQYKVVDIQINDVVVSENSTGIKSHLEKYSAPDRSDTAGAETRDK